MESDDKIDVIIPLPKGLRDLVKILEKMPSTAYIVEGGNKDQMCINLGLDRPRKYP